MPLPWLIGAAAVAAAVAVVKAVKDDSDEDDSDERIRKHEREVKRQHKRDSLAEKVDNLKKDRLDEARELLARSSEILEKPLRKTDLNPSEFEKALSDKSQSTSGYGKGMVEILGMSEYGQKDCTPKERGEFLINLQMLESLYGTIPFSSDEQKGLGEIREVVSRLNRLETLKQQLEQQG